MSTPLHNALRKLLATEDAVTFLILRVTLAVVIFPHGLQKVFGWFGGFGFAATMEGFTGAGFPWLLALLAVIAESLGALALFFGILGRVAAFGIGCVMAVAAYAHRPYGFFMNWFGNQAGEGFEFHLLAIGIALAILLRGSGALSVDGVLSRLLKPAASRGASGSTPTLSENNFQPRRGAP